MITIQVKEDPLQALEKNLHGLLDQKLLKAGCPPDAQPTV